MGEALEVQKLTIGVVGGPLDGQIIEAEAFPRDYQMIDLKVWVEEEEFSGSLDEPYILRRLPSEDGSGEEWWAVWPPLVRPSEDDLALGPTDDDVEHMRAAHSDLGGQLLTVPCKRGEHDWTPWQQTPRGNRVRQCRRCHVGQGSIL